MDAFIGFIAFYRACVTLGALGRVLCRMAVRRLQVGYSEQAAVTGIGVQIVPRSGKEETRVVPEREEFGIGLGVNRGYASGAARGYISESERFARSGTCTSTGALVG